VLDLLRQPQEVGGGRACRRHREAELAEPCRRIAAAERGARCLADMRQEQVLGADAARLDDALGVVDGDEQDAVAGRQAQLKVIARREAEDLEPRPGRLVQVGQHLRQGAPGRQCRGAQDEPLALMHAETPWRALHRVLRAEAAAGPGQGLVTRVGRGQAARGDHVHLAPGARRVVLPQSRDALLRPDRSGQHS
jgi:hypothetical protein